MKILFVEDELPKNIPRIYRMFSNNINKAVNSPTLSSRIPRSAARYAQREVS